MHTSNASPETLQLAEYLNEKHNLKANSALIGMRTDQILLQQKEGYSDKMIVVVVDYIGKRVRVQLRNRNGIPVGGLDVGYQGVNSIDELDIVVAMYADLLKKN